MLYREPHIKSYSTDVFIEIFGPCQNQYAATFYTTTGNGSVNVDGYVRNDGITVNTTISSTGDTNSNVGERGLVGFDISSIQGKTVVSATLRIYQYIVTGSPYTDLGTIVVDHINFGSSMDVGDYSLAALASNIGTISSNATYEWKTLDVTSYVQADLVAGRTSSQYRIRFTTETDLGGDTDYSGFESAENNGSTGNKPELVVTYN
jgi:hypothetical protein